MGDVRQDDFYARYTGRTQRARLLDAAIRVVADKGFGGATVSDIVTAAGVSRSTFYEHFDGKAECLLEAHKAATRIIIQTVTEAVLPRIEEGWTVAASTAIAAYFDAIRAEPEATQVAFVDLRSLGRASIAAELDSQDRWIEQILSLQRYLKSQGHAVPAVSEPILRLVAAGVSARYAQALTLEDPAAIEQIEHAVRELLDLPDREVP